MDDGLGATTTPRDPWPWLGLASATAFVLVAVGLSHRRAIVFDEAAIAVVQALPIPIWAWELLTSLGGFILIPIGIGFVLTTLWTGHLRLAVIVAVILIVAALTTDAIKDYVARPRPTPDPLVLAPGFSFPSGHALNSTVTYGLLAVVAWRTHLSLTTRRTAAIVGVILPVLIGLSRIALGVHYPTDVIGGWLAGVAFVSLAATLIRRTGAMERDVGWRRRRRTN